MEQINQSNHWQNWSGDLRFTPARILRPQSEQEVQELVRQALHEGRRLRVTGSSHSCAPLFRTSDILVHTGALKGLLGQQGDEVCFAAGTTYEEAGHQLFELSRAVENTGYINKQALAGAISTGTHGAGKKLRNLSSQVCALRLVDGQAQVHSFHEQQDADLMNALRLSLGAFGIITAVTLKTVPAFRVERKEYFCSTDDCLRHLDRLMEENRNFNFYWYPRRDDVKLVICNEPGRGYTDLPFARPYDAFAGWSHYVLPSEQELRFNEMEYAVELDVAADCFRDLRRRVLEKHRATVAWRILFRPVAADEAWLSNSGGKNIAAITLHHNAGLPYTSYFNDMEPIFRHYGGRPHWAKKHNLDAEALQALYPQWQRFLELRQHFDPHKIFINDYLEKLLFKHH